MRVALFLGVAIAVTSTAYARDASLGNVYTMNIEVATAHAYSASRHAIRVHNSSDVVADHDFNRFLAPHDMALAEIRAQGPEMLRIPKGLRRYILETPQEIFNEYIRTPDAMTPEGYVLTAETSVSIAQVLYVFKSRRRGEVVYPVFDVQEEASTLRAMQPVRPWERWNNAAEYGTILLKIADLAKRRDVQFESSLNTDHQKLQTDTLRALNFNEADIVEQIIQKLEIRHASKHPLPPTNAAPFWSYPFVYPYRVAEGHKWGLRDVYVRLAIANVGRKEKLLVRAFHFLQQSSEFKREDRVLAALEIASLARRGVLTDRAVRDIEQMRILPSSLLLALSSLKHSNIRKRGNRAPEGENFYFVSLDVEGRMFRVGVSTKSAQEQLVVVSVTEAGDMK